MEHFEGSPMDSCDADNGEAGDILEEVRQLRCAIAVYREVIERLLQTQERAGR